MLTMFVLGLVLLMFAFGVWSGYRLGLESARIDLMLADAGLSRLRDEDRII